MSSDPVAFEIFKNLFVSVAEEIGVTLQRTSFSPNIKERMDYSCAVYDGDGNTIAQGDHMPVHLGAMPLSVRAAIDAGPMASGDVVLVNDPFRGGTHLPDITCVSPVFVPGRETPAFYVANRAHHSDVGGMTPGSMPLATELFQEGLILPPVKLMRGGEMVADVRSILLANVRTPVEREGDLAAQIAANRTGEKRLLEIVRKYGLDETLLHAGEMQRYAERMMRATLTELPDGIYEFEDFLDDDGITDDPIRIRAAVTIAGDRATVDFTGSAPQTTGGVNANFAMTLAGVVYCFRCLIEEDVPYNAGISKPITVIAPEGSIVNARRPAAVAGGNVETSQRITDVVFGALAQALPHRVQAASQGTMNNITLGGTDPRTGEPFAYYETLAGGMGGRAGKAGLSGVHTHMSNTRNTPVEAIEQYLPLKITKYARRTGSGGAGAAAGGDGLVREYEMLTETEVTVISDRRKTGPYGLNGGESGACGRNTLVTRGKEKVLPGKFNRRLKPGERLRIETPGGGGYGAE